MLPLCFLNDISFSLKRNRTANELKCKIKNTQWLNFQMSLIHSKNICAVPIHKLALLFFYLKTMLDSWYASLCDSHNSSLTCLCRIFLFIHFRPYCEKSWRLACVCSFKELLFQLTLQRKKVYFSNWGPNPNLAKMKSKASSGYFVVGFL